MGKLEERLERYAAFRTFHTDAKSIFERIAAGDPQHQRLQRSHGFCISPGGSFGGSDSRLVEVFYGQIPFDSVTENPTTMLTRPTRRLLIEQGATLSYQRLDDGKVVVCLLPSRTQSMHPTESLILMGFVDPRRFTLDDTLLWSHWDSLVAYMECTSLDGEPTVTDRVRMQWLRWCKRLAVDGKVQERRILGPLRWLASNIEKILKLFFHQPPTKPS